MKNKKLSKNYLDYIKSKTWQIKRTERLKIDNFTCQICGNKRNLNVHHLTYKNFKNENIYSDLITLCGKCHQKIEEEKIKLPQINKKHTKTQERFYAVYYIIDNIFYKKIVKGWDNCNNLCKNKPSFHKKFINFTGAQKYIDNTNKMYILNKIFAGKRNLKNKEKLNNIK